MILKKQQGAWRRQTTPGPVLPETGRLGSLHPGTARRRGTLERSLVSIPTVVQETLRKEVDDIG